MRHRTRWPAALTSAVLALSVLGVPDVAVARDSVGVPDVVVRHAPVVYFHPEEVLLPYPADIYLERSEQYLEGDADPPYRYLVPGDDVGGRTLIGSAPAYYEYEPGRYVVYWFFYSRDRQGWTGSGVDVDTVKEHDGDWEHVVVRLDENDRPTDIAYYQHDCQPRLFAWADVPEFVDGTHPAVYSALGSHASFWETRGRTEPMDVECPSVRAFPDDVRFDAVEKGDEWRTWEDVGLVDARSEEWYGFTGLWGPPSTDWRSPSTEDDWYEYMHWSSGGRGPKKDRVGLIIPDGWDQPQASSSAAGPSGKPMSRPVALPARVPWSAGQAHELISSYDIGSPEGFGLLFRIDSPDTVYPVYPGEVVYAGCASGRAAPLGRMVVVRRTLGSEHFDTVYGHLASIDAAMEDASTLTPRSVGADQPLGTVGSLTDLSLDTCPGSAAIDRLYIGVLRGADIRPTGEISGGRPVYAEPMVGRGAYEGFTWWHGPATATDLHDGVGEPWGRWAKASEKDGTVIDFGDTVTLSAEVKDSVPLKELRFTAYYKGWPRPKSAARLDGFSENRTWRILAVCRPPGVGGEPAKTRRCQWDGSATDAVVTFEWDPTKPVNEKVTPWQPLSRVAINGDSDECVSVTLSFDVFDQAGYRRQAPGGVKKARKCPKAVASTGTALLSARPGEPEPDLVFAAEKKTRQQDRWVYLQPPRPPAAPGRVRRECRNRAEASFCYRLFVRWQDRARTESGYRVYGRALLWPDPENITCRDLKRAYTKPLRGPRVLLTSAPANATSVRIDVERAYELAGEAGSVADVELYIVAWNQAGESAEVSAGVFGQGDVGCDLTVG